MPLRARMSFFAIRRCRRFQMDALFSLLIIVAILLPLLRRHAAIFRCCHIIDTPRFHIDTDAAAIVTRRLLHGAAPLLMLLRH